MFEEIFDFEYTSNMYPERLKPLDRRELCLGMSEPDVDKYLSLVKQLYEAMLKIKEGYGSFSTEEHRRKNYEVKQIYSNLIKHLFKCDAISDETYIELYKHMSAEISCEARPDRPNTYVRDSLDDFRLAFEWNIVEHNENVDVSDEYLMNRYGYGWCVRPNTHKKWVADSDLFIYRCTEECSLPFHEISYWEARELLKKIRDDIKKNADEQVRVDNYFVIISRKKPFFSLSQKWTYKEPKNVTEWYSIHRALKNEENKLSAIEAEVQRIFEGMHKPDEMVGSGATLYIFKGKTLCHLQKHPIIPATAVLFDTNDREIEMDVDYCPVCDKYLLNYISFEHYREKYGVLIGKLRMIASNGTTREFELAEESPLKLCGYNVSEADGLSTSTRRFILSKIIHDGIMTKSEVIHYLEHFINMNGAKKENVLATRKWRDDLDFVHQYNMSIQPKTFIISIKKY